MERAVLSFRSVLIGYVISCNHFMGEILIYTDVGTLVVQITPVFPKLC